MSGEWGEEHEMVFAQAGYTAEGLLIRVESMVELLKVAEERSDPESRVVRGILLHSIELTLEVFELISGQKGRL